MRLGDGILTDLAGKASGQFVVAKLAENYQYLCKKVDGTVPRKGICLSSQESLCTQSHDYEQWL